MGLNEIKWNLKMAYLPGTGAKQFLIINVLDKGYVFIMATWVDYCGSMKYFPFTFFHQITRYPKKNANDYWAFLSVIS